MKRVMNLRYPAVAMLTLGAFLLAGCETIGPVGKRIDYKSTSAAPALELPPELSQPRFDDRFTVSTASGLAAANAARPRQSDLLPTNPDARIARAGNERWIVATATPDQAWSTVRQFWTENGFVVAIEQPAVGVMETDWAENRADTPSDFLRRTIGKYLEAFTSTYKRDKFRTRIERGADPGTVEIYVSHRGMEQVPTVKIDNVQGAGRNDAGGEGAGDGCRPRTRREGRRWHVQADRRRSVRSRVAPGGTRARPVGIHRRRPRPLDGHLLRALRRPRFGHDAQGPRAKLAREAHVLEGRRKGQARAISDQGGRGHPRQRGQRAGSEGRARPHAEQRKDPRVAEGPAQVMIAAGTVANAAVCPCIPRERLMSD